jgi:hypothetical protein
MFQGTVQDRRTTLLGLRHRTAPGVRERPLTLTKSVSLRCSGGIMASPSTACRPVTPETRS